MTRLRFSLTAFVALFAMAGVLLASSASATVGPTLLFLGSEGPTILLNNKPKEVVSVEFQSTAARFSAKDLTREITLSAEKGVVAGVYLEKIYMLAKGAVKAG